MCHHVSSFQLLPEKGSLVPPLQTPEDGVAAPTAPWAPGGPGPSVGREVSFLLLGHPHPHDLGSPLRLSSERTNLSSGACEAWPDYRTTSGSERPGQSPVLIEQQTIGAGLIPGSVCSVPTDWTTCCHHSFLSSQLCRSAFLRREVNNIQRTDGIK